MLTIQFSFSTSAFSSDETSRYIVPFLKFIAPTLSGERLIFWHHVIRKAAHVTEYCISECWSIGRFRSICRIRQWFES
jgi:hypothetical protein